MDRDELNDYLRQRPLLEGLWLITTLDVTTVLRLKPLCPGWSVVDIASNTGYQFVSLATDGPCYVTYVGFSRAVN